MFARKLRKGKQGAQEVPETPSPPHSLSGGVSRIVDLISPDGFKVSDSHVQVGAGRYVRSYFVTQLPSRIAIGWLDDLYSLGDVDIAIHVRPGVDRDVINELTRKITQLEAQLILDERRGDIRNVSLLRRTVEDAWALREQIQTNQNRMFYVSVIFTVAADSLPELERRSLLLEERLGGRAIHVRQAFLRQFDGLRSVVPLGENLVGDVYRNLDLGAGTALFPFGGSDLVHDGGVLVGVNLVTGAPVFYNSHAGPPVLLNPHMAVFATSGAGKTFFVNLLAARSAALGVHTVFVDPEGGYSALVERLGGTYARFSLGSPVLINPLDLEEEEREDGTAVVSLADKILDVKRLVAVMVEATGESLNAEENAVLEDAVREVYAERGITRDPGSLYEQYGDVREGVVRLGRKKKAMPVLSDLRRCLAARPGRAAERVCVLLGPYLAGGSQGLFDGQSSVRLGGVPLVAFDVSGLDEKFLRPLAMHVVLSWVWEKFVKKNPAVKKRVVVDEAWMFMRHRDTALFLEHMARRARKRNCSLCVVSQSFREFAESPEGRAVLSNVDTLFLMQQNPKDIDEVGAAFRLSEGEREFLLSAQVGDGLLRVGRQAVAVHVRASPEECEFLLPRAE